MSIGLHKMYAWLIILMLNIFAKPMKTQIPIAGLVMPVPTKMPGPENDSSGASAQVSLHRETRLRTYTLIQPG